MENIIKFKGVRDGVSISYVCSDLGLDIGVCSFKQSRIFQDDTNYSPLAENLNLILHDSNPAKKLLVYKSIMTEIDKLHVSVNIFHGERYDENAEYNATHTLFRMLGSKRPKNGSKASLKDIFEIMYKNKIQTYDV